MVVSDTEHKDYGVIYIHNSNKKNRDSHFNQSTEY